MTWQVGRLLLLLATCRFALIWGLPAADAGPVISFTNKAGVLITNAEVVRTNDGVSIVWEKDGGAMGGTELLQDLPPNLQDQFGYDPDKTAAAEQLARDRAAQLQLSAAEWADLARQDQLAAAKAAASNSIASKKSTAAAQKPTPQPPASHYHYGGRRVRYY